MQISDVEHHGFAAPQTPGVDDLEQRRVAERRQRALPAAVDDAVDLVIRVVKEPLQLLAREPPPAGSTLELTRVGRRVPLVADHPGRPAEPPLALVGPAIPSIADELSEQREVIVVPADRRVR